MYMYFLSLSLAPLQDPRVTVRGVTTHTAHAVSEYLDQTLAVQNAARTATPFLSFDLGKQIA